MPVNSTSWSDYAFTDIGTTMASATVTMASTTATMSEETITTDLRIKSTPWSDA